ncbi:MAG: hypothetical protein CMH70_00575 [Nitrosomonadaceae bacterium]|nr:hypothetical protein [Nitrosomonadaceae bacterium]|tara:strand:+ start:3482 stop:5350 length:1869 start_codon:yes stop_codon:yes gene_type:complete
MKLSIRKYSPALDETGFTLIELMISSAIAIALLALVAGIITSQGDFFSREIALGEMQSDGRAAIDFLDRSTRNSGYNVIRGSRFLAASDHYISMVYDEDDDGVIQNDEVIILSVSNAMNDTTETFFVSPYFDFDDDGEVGQDETRDYEIRLALSKPPFNLYLFVPNKLNSEYKQHTAAHNIENLIIRYYDKNNMALPQGINLDTNDFPIPPYALSRAELNKIRKIEFEIIVRSNNEDPNKKFINNGAYQPGSVADQSGVHAYNDRYHRQTFKAVSSPKNLSVAPYGKISLSSKPDQVTCPEVAATITASVLDLSGEPILEPLKVRFNSSEGQISPEITSISKGEASTTLNYDWSTSGLTATVSASAQIDVEGKNITIFNAIPVAFEGKFADDFNAGLQPGWTPPWVVEDGKYRTREIGANNSTNGCEKLKNYDVVVNIQKEGDHSQGDYFGLILRSPSTQEDNSLGYYVARVICFSCDTDPVNHKYRLELIDRRGSVDDMLASVVLEPDEFPFITGEDYTLKASVAGDTLRAKFWKSSEIEPSDNPDETPKAADPPNPEQRGRTIMATDTSYTQGKIGLTTNTTVNTFDNLAVGFTNNTTINNSNDLETNFDDLEEGFELGF